MRKKLTLAGIAIFAVCGLFAQTSPEKPSMVVETMYIMPKKGMEVKFEAAVKAHDVKFHPDGPYKAGLRKVEYGDKAGWYVWVFGPTTYASLDTRPAKGGGHDVDWTTTVDPLVDQYGEIRLWQLNDNLSYGMDLLKSSKYYEAWNVVLKKGNYKRFEALAEKLKKAYEALGTDSFIVYNNVFHTANGPDVGLVWGFNSYDAWNKDSGVKTSYEKLNGEGSWQKMVDEWQDIIVDYSSEVRSFIR